MIKGSARLLKGAIITVCLALSSVAAAWAGLLDNSALAQIDSPPPGSYQQSCDNVSLKGNRLSAYCRAKNGSSTLSVINNILLCEGDIWNDDGNLTCKKTNAPLLRVRQVLYFLGAENGPISNQSKAIKKSATTSISTGQGQGCKDGVCTFYFGFVVDRRPAKGDINPFCEIVVDGPGSSRGVGNTYLFGTGKYTQHVILPVQLKVGENRLTVEVDQKKELTDSIRADNRFSVTVLVKP